MFSGLKDSKIFIVPVVITISGPIHSSQMFVELCCQEGRLEEFKGLTSEFDRCHGRSSFTHPVLSCHGFVEGAL